jgi:integrative and conjugative element protein (TIGR02256 family)
MFAASGAISYSIGTSGQLIIFSPKVIEHFTRYRQRRWWQTEAGGQLFARLRKARIEIECATGPRRTDRRTRTKYIPDRVAEQAEIMSFHKRGLHFVGDWHTHPENWPRPSTIDDQSIGECVRQSSHVLNGFVLVIVGRMDPTDGMYVAIHDGTERHVLNLSGHSNLIQDV